MRLNESGMDFVEFCKWAEANEHDVFATMDLEERLDRGLDNIARVAAADPSAIIALPRKVK